MSQARWELENAVQTVQDSDVDAVYHWNPAEQREMQQARPWLQDPTYFKRCLAGRGDSGEGCRLSSMQDLT